MTSTLIKSGQKVSSLPNSPDAIYHSMATINSHRVFRPTSAQMLRDSTFSRSTSSGSAVLRISPSWVAGATPFSISDWSFSSKRCCRCRRRRDSRAERIRRSSNDHLAKGTCFSTGASELERSIRRTAGRHFSMGTMARPTSKARTEGRSSRALITGGGCAKMEPMNRA